ncbi:MAG: nicotinamide riboside transporter PnuC [Halieaceae bacterium]|jgi:nicotinamide mononucleotide transporter|nr:nicotinamide riboside transporter PnuC [Halieaceae bacterium]
MDTLTLLEAVAVGLGILYLLLAMQERLSCWYAAFASTLIFLFLFWDVALLMESALQVYYLAMAVYGWWQWRGGSDTLERARELPISRRPLRWHLLAIGTVLLATALSGSLLADYTGAALPYLDSFTTWGAVLTTWMVARKILENWLYWIAVDGASIALYLDRELYLTAGLFAVYLVIVVCGFLAWTRHYRAQTC